MKLLLGITFSIFFVQSGEVYAAPASDDSEFLNTWSQQLKIGPDEKVTMNTLSLEAVNPESSSKDPITAEELSQQVKLMGKGIQNRKTNEMIALACVGDKIEGTQERSCDQLQHIYLKNPDSPPTLIGEKFTIQNGKIKTSLRELSKSYRKYRWAQSKQARVKRAFEISKFSLLGFSGFLIVVAFTGPIIITPVAMVTLLSSVGALVLGGAAYAILVDSDAIRPMNFKDTESVVYMNDQNGWSWASETHQISNQKFAHYYQFLE